VTGLTGAWGHQAINGTVVGSQGAVRGGPNFPIRRCDMYMLLGIKFFYVASLRFNTFIYMYCE